MSFLLQPYLAPSKRCNVTPWGRPSVGESAGWAWTSAATNATHIKKKRRESEREEGGKQKGRSSSSSSSCSSFSSSLVPDRLSSHCSKTAAEIKNKNSDTCTPALSIFEAIRPHLFSPDMITDEHYICFQLTKHGHRCGTASQHAALRGRGVADDKSAHGASKYGQIYIWSLSKGCQFQNNTAQCKPSGPNKWLNNKWFGWERGKKKRFFFPIKKDSFIRRSEWGAVSLN